MLRFYESSFHATNDQATADKLVKAVGSLIEVANSVATHRPEQINQAVNDAITNSDVSEWATKFKENLKAM